MVLQIVVKILYAYVYSYILCYVIDYDEIDKTLDTLNVIQSSQGFEKTITNKPKLKSRNISVVDEIPRYACIVLSTIVKTISFMYIVSDLVYQDRM